MKSKNKPFRRKKSAPRSAGRTTFSLKRKGFSSKISNFKHAPKKTKRLSYANTRYRYDTHEQNDFTILLDRYGYKKTYGEAAEKEAKEVYAKGIKELENDDLHGKLNCTKDCVITIDGEDAKDFDDGVCLKKTKQGYILDVHIADVSHYVTAGGSIDREAMRRGTSVYVVDEVLAMLPQVLSNDLCSLVEGKRRLTFLCRMHLTTNGVVKQYTFHPSVICSKKRCTYTEVENALQQGIVSGGMLQHGVLQQLKQMADLQKILFERRMEHGSIDFESRELHIELQQKKVVSIRPKACLSSEGLIEEFMLLANQCTAAFMETHGKKGIYRVHEPPNPQKLQAFHSLLALRGYSLEEKQPWSSHRKKSSTSWKNPYQSFLESIEHPLDHKLFSYALLKSMQQARYTPKNSGHYGLGFERYCHFTSPIRRYPDLMVHRLIKQILRESQSQSQGPALSKKHHRLLPYGIADLERIASTSSIQERKAEEAEREYKKLKCLRYLQDRFDKTFEGVITGISEMGLFVRETTTEIEGMIPCNFYERGLVYDADGWVVRWAGAKSSEQKKGDIVYEIGGRVQMQLASLNYRRLFIDFRLQEEKS